MDFEPTAEQRTLVETVREFCKKEVAPKAKQWDDEERFPAEVIPKLAELGLMGMTVSPEYGGAGLSLSDYAMVIEELGRYDGSVCLTMASHNSLCTGHIYRLGSEAQKRKYLPGLARRASSGPGA